MATHGTIMLKSTEEKGSILLQTPSDGHTAKAIQTILSLPEFVGSRSWYADVIGRHIKQNKELNLEAVKDFGRCQGDFGSTYLLGVAHWIVATHFDRWRIIPKGFEGYLADYDLKDEHHLHVQIDPYLWKEGKESETESGILIQVDFEKYKDGVVGYKGDVWGAKPITLADWIETANKKMPEEAKINTAWEGVDKGIFLPFYERFIQSVLDEAKRLKASIDPLV